jgi:hypothetical protein
MKQKALLRRLERDLPKPAPFGFWLWLSAVEGGPPSLHCTDGYCVDFDITGYPLAFHDEADRPISPTDPILDTFWRHPKYNPTGLKPQDWKPPKTSEESKADL